MLQDDSTQNPNQPGEWTPPPPPPPVSNPQQPATGVVEPIVGGGVATPPPAPDPEIPVAGGEEPQGEQDGGMGGPGVPPIA